MNDSKNDGHFHLIRVCKKKRIIRAVPTRVYTERIGMAITFAGYSAISFSECPARVPDMQRLGEYIIIHKAGVYGKKTHEKDNVASAEFVISKGCRAGG